MKYLIYSTKIIIVFFMITSANGCPVKTPPKTISIGSSTQENSLGPGDVFDVRVFNEKSLTNTYQVASDGTIDYPLIGRIKVAGLKPQEVAILIAEKLRAGNFLKDPQVSVLVQEYRSKMVHVLGQVKKPGTFPYQENMNIIQAITLAGGLTPIANANKTTITRKVEGKEVIIRAEVTKISKGQAPNMLLRPGDIIYVPERVF